MKLVGLLASPYVRRVAISARLLGFELTNQPLSVFDDYDEFRRLNPLVKAPTLILDDGTMLVDSTVIIDYLSQISTNDYSLMPIDKGDYERAVELLGVALVATEKIVQITYETMRRPAESLHQPWLERLEEQLDAALRQLDTGVGNANPWLFDNAVTQPDISIAVMWRVSQFIVSDHVDAANFPHLVNYSERAERLPEFLACPPGR